MTSSHEKLEKSIGCGAVIQPTTAIQAMVVCTREFEDFCPECQIKRDVCDELTSALGDTAILDMIDRVSIWHVFFTGEQINRVSIRKAYERVGRRIKCPT